MMRALVCLLLALVADALPTNGTELERAGALVNALGSRNGAVGAIATGATVAAVAGGTFGYWAARKLAGYDSFPHWDGDSCLVGMPARFEGECTYEPRGSFAMPSQLKVGLHKMGLKDCARGAHCTCFGCEELNKRWLEGTHDGSAFHTPRKWVQELNHADMLYKQVRPTPALCHPSLRSSRHSTRRAAAVSRRAPPREDA